MNMTIKEYIWAVKQSPKRKDVGKMKFNIDKHCLIAGSMVIGAGMIMAFFEPVGGALTAAIGGVVLQLNIDTKPEKKPKGKSEVTKQ